jgi:hypothetical protein
MKVKARSRPPARPRAVPGAGALGRCLCSFGPHARAVDAVVLFGSFPCLPASPCRRLFAARCGRQLNIAYPPNGTQKTYNFEDENCVRPFYDKRISAEVPGDSLGDDWKGYVLRISGTCSSANSAVSRSGWLGVSPARSINKRGGDMGERG